MADFGAVARPYARALFELARDSGSLGEWSSALDAAAAVVAEPAARRYLGQPGLGDVERAGFVTSLASGVAGADLLGSDAGKNFLKLLAENERLGALPEIAAQFEQLKSQAENKVKVTVTTASPVDDALKAKIAEGLRKKLGREVELELALDPTLIGGAVIRAEDMVIDGSLKSRLRELAASLID